MSSEGFCNASRKVLVRLDDQRVIRALREL